MRSEQSSEPPAPDDVNPTRRAEYQAALALLGPQIVGMQSVENDTDISDEARDKIREELDDRLRRENLLYDALAQLDDCNDAHNALLNDGYPDLPKGLVTTSVLKELQKRRDAINVAIEQFDSVDVSVNLGNPADKS